ncbi:MAG: hypothetical protein KDA77_08625 [Planctomycetaceae bacterium]|nr:hypothetical protein [Planctomycetaceae bacterium]
MDLIEIGMELGERLGIDDEKLFLDHLETVQDLYFSTCRLLKEQAEQQQTQILSKPEIYTVVMASVSKVTGIPEAEISSRTLLRDICD